jgi:GNAT superfamily N-acetyltransferase
MEPTIRALTADDWRMLRDLRLRALEDSPDSFRPTFEESSTLPEEYWRGWAAGRPGALQAWAAFRGALPAGIVSATMRDGAGKFGALWVAPDERGEGLGRRLVETACEWLEACGASRIELDVTEGNPAAALYERLGFVATGDRKPLRDGSPLFEATMARETPLRPGNA